MRLQESFAHSMRLQESFAALKAHERTKGPSLPAPSYYIMMIRPSKLIPLKGKNNFEDYGQHQHNVYVSGLCAGENPGYVRAEGRSSL